MKHNIKRIYKDKYDEPATFKHFFETQFQSHIHERYVNYWYRTNFVDNFKISLSISNDLP